MPRRRANGCNVILPVLPIDGKFVLRVSKSDVEDNRPPSATGRPERQTWPKTPVAARGQKKPQERPLPGAVAAGRGEGV